MIKRVVIGLSGGVDSSVAAYMLQQEGYEVIGLFMKNWHDDRFTLNNECPWIDDSTDALMVAEKLGIPFQTIDLSTPYRERIINYMFNEYEKGRTPNPDILCNREIKFDVFLNAALSLDADYIASGHYCRIGEINKGSRKLYQLLSGTDKNKDQSYFLCQLNQFQLSKALFPIGNMIKPEVRKLARSLGLVTAGKKDSQGLCFVGKISLPKFLQQKLEPREGKIIEIPADSEIYKKSEVPVMHAQMQGIDDADLIVNPLRYHPGLGKIIGKHQGAHYFTIGQRKGLQVGGTREPLFIIATDTIENIIYVGQGENHPGLFRRGLFIKKDEAHWIRDDLTINPGDTMEVMARIRYRQPLEKATLYMEDDRLNIIFKSPQRGVSPGQFAAWYVGDEVIGSGVIN
ncbi:MAG TPA: tRNA 2-thiouridine(34) synthase MnmA [Cyclobacteriaceae bacterium]|nr:tRNA 2-thiouridine(34) synthase MnmA [Cyclobacteriaceae bacterium]